MTWWAYLLATGGVVQIWMVLFGIVMVVPIAAIDLFRPEFLQSQTRETQLVIRCAVALLYLIVALLGNPVSYVVLLGGIGSVLSLLVFFPRFAPYFLGTVVLYYVFGSLELLGSFPEALIGLFVILSMGGAAFGMQRLLRHPKSVSLISIETASIFWALVTFAIAGLLFKGEFVPPLWVGLEFIVFTYLLVSVTIVLKPDERIAQAF